MVFVAHRTTGRCITVFAITGMLGGSAALSTGASAPAVPTSAAAKPQVANRPVINPHLHIAHQETPTRTHFKTADIVPWWHHHWSYHTWVVLHRGLGTVVGFVHDASGRPIANARVVLKAPKGGGFAKASRRHATQTNSNGGFMMAGVRHGGYRVVAIVGKTRNHVLTEVRVGGIERVAIQLEQPAVISH